MAKVNEFLEEPESVGEPALPADEIKKFNMSGATTGRTPSKRVVSPPRPDDVDRPVKRVKSAYRRSGRHASMRAWARQNRHDPAVRQWLENKGVRE